MTPEHKQAMIEGRSAGAEMFRMAGALLAKDTVVLLERGVPIHETRQLGSVMTRTAWIYCQQVNRALYLRRLEMLPFALWDVKAAVHPVFDDFGGIPKTARELFLSDEAAWAALRGLRPCGAETLKPWDVYAYEAQQARILKITGRSS